MGKNTKLLATVIPIRYNNGRIRIAVSLTPRLPDSGKLIEYYEIQHWCEYLKYFNTTIRFKYYDARDTRNIIPLTAIASSTPDPAKAKSYWESMFFDNTHVNGWVIDKAPYRLADMITQAQLRNEIRRGLNDAIARLLSDGDMGDEKDPYHYDQNRDVRRNNMASLAEYLEDLKDKDIHYILNDPIITNSRYRPFLQDLYKALEDINKRSRQLYNQLSLQLELAEIQKRNYEETTEFHKRFSAYANHPEILKKTGWIREYDLDDKSTKLLFGKTGYLSIYWDPNIPHEKGELLKNEPDIASSDIEAYNAFKQEIDFIFPYTAVKIPVQRDITKDHVLTAPFYSEAPLLQVEDHNGYVLLTDHDQYEVNPYVVDKAQILARIETLLQSNYDPSSSNLPVQDRNNIEVLAAEEFNLAEDAARGATNQEYATSGISIDIRNLKEVLKNTITLDPGNITEQERRALDLTEGSGIIYRHNLVAGYRVDVMALNAINDMRTFSKGSLCEKIEFYTGAHIQMERYPAINDDTVIEGLVIESAQGSNSGRLYVDEELFRWNDASLIAGAHGKHTGTTREDDDPNLDVKIMPGASSMVPLRFGWKYSFALRPADIVGNGQEPVHRNSVFTDTELRQYIAGKAPMATIEKLKKYWTKPIFYQRVEAVNSPTVYLANRILASGSVADDGNGEGLDEQQEKAKPNLPNWIPQRWGEDITTMVIRSYYRKAQARLVFEPKLITSRYIAPPRTNWNFVVQHGTLNPFFKFLKDTIRPNSRGEFSIAQQRQLEAIKNEFLEAAEVRINPEIHTVISPGPLPFMYDPIVDGFEFVVRNVIKRVELPRSAPAVNYDPLTAPYRFYQYWRNYAYYKLQLQEHAGSDSFNIDIKEMETTFGLRPGCEESITIGCALMERTMHYQIPTEDIFLPGIPQKRRSRLNLVHAVQKPCLIKNTFPGKTGNFLDKIKALPNDFSVADRNPGIALGLFFGRFNLFPALTADAYLLHIQYFTFTSNREAEEREKGVSIRLVSKVVKTGFLPVNTSNETDVVFSNIDHVFEDTKYRKVQYRIEAVSKFKKYFHTSLAPDGFSILGTDANDSFVPDNELVKESWSIADYESRTANWLSLKSSRQPDAPVIDRIVPLMRWEKTGNVVHRYCDTVRIYLEGDWYSSGPGEKLAILYMDNPDFNSANILDPDKEPEISLDNIISQYGKDPIATEVVFADYPTMIKLKDRSFDTSCGNCTALNRNICIDQLDFEKPDLKDYPNLMVRAMLYSVDYRYDNRGIKYEDEDIISADPASPGRFYVDIKLKDYLADEGAYQLRNEYFPFIRFAVARYQENSIALPGLEFRYKFSKVVVSNFVQLMPQRTVNVYETATHFSINFNAPARRLIDSDKKGFPYKVNNEVYALPEKESGLSDGLYQLENHEATKGIPLLTENTLFKVPIDGGPYMIAEYEIYQNPDICGANEFQTNENDPRRNYTRRLVFSYLIKRSTEKEVKNGK